MIETRIKVVAVFILIVLFGIYMNFTVYATSSLPVKGDGSNGFKVIDLRELEHINAKIITFTHEKTGAKVVYFANDDINCAFDISFKTPVINNSGISHILEHIILSGSKKYPSSTLFTKLINQTYNTSMNAYTSQNNTSFALSSLSEEELYNLTDYYLDSVFNPMIYYDDSAFYREAWHYELDDFTDELTVSGTVYNEVQGTNNILDTCVYNTRKSLFPNSHASYISEGESYDMININNTDLIEYHSKYYHPSNSLVVLYGDMDYQKFLGLIDTYFSQYKSKNIEIDFNSYIESDTRCIQQSYDYPIANENISDIKSYITYAIECKDASNIDIVFLNLLVNILNDSSSDIKQWVANEFPGAVVSFKIDLDAPEPFVFATLQNADNSDADEFKRIVEESLKNIVLNKSYVNSINSVISALRRSKAKGLVGENIGVLLATETAARWAINDDINAMFDFLEGTFDLVECVDYDVFVDVIEKYLISTSSRTAVVITTPVKGLQEYEQSEFKDKLQIIKNSMTDEELDIIIDQTQKYQTSYNKNDELDKKLISKIGTVKAQELPIELKDYNITDTIRNEIRYVNAESDLNDIGKGRIMLDISDIKCEDLYWISLYNILIGSLDTEKYSAIELFQKASNYAEYNTTILTLPDKNKNGFTPYLIFEYEGFANDSDEIFDLAEQILLKTDFSDVMSIRGLIQQYINLKGNDIEQYGYNYLIQQAISASDLSKAYSTALNGLGFYEFLQEISTTLESNPLHIIERLEAIKNALNNGYGATIVYAGSKESIYKNNDSADRFFANMPNNKKEIENYSELRSNYENIALVVDSPVDYNGIYAPLDILDIGYDGRMNVVMSYVMDSYLLPELRNKYNVYSVGVNYNENGLAIVTYRDPDLEKTLEVYAGLSDVMNNIDLTQEDLDKYIISVGSKFTIPKGKLDDVYCAATDYTNNESLEVKVQRLNDMKFTTVEDVKEYSKVFDKLWNKGIIFTMGGVDTIKENECLYGEIFNPLDYDIKNITIFINDMILETDIPAFIEDDRAMVPMRNIFEMFDAKIIWDGERRRVTAIKDDLVMILTINSNTIEFIRSGGDWIKINMDCPVIIKNDCTMIPLRAISEILGYDVEWDSQYNSIYISN